MEFPGMSIHDKFRLVAYPVNEHLFAGDTFYRHRDIPATIVLLNESPEMLVKLRLLVTVWVFLFVLDPQEVHVHLTSFVHQPVIVFLKIRHGNIIPAVVLWRVEHFLHF